jgi:hypothetical protein
MKILSAPYWEVATENLARDGCKKHPPPDEIYTPILGVFQHLHEQLWS